MADNVNTVGNTAADYLLPKKQIREPKTELGKDDFLTIFLTQLQNQDPTSPMENIESIAQMAQFSALEAMTNMSSAMTQTQSYGMIGKGVVGVTRHPETGVKSDVIGTADSAGVLNGKPYVMVSDHRVYVEDISQVFDNAIIAGGVDNVLAGTAMVGKFARAEVSVDGVKQYFEGKVERMSVSEGKLFVTIEGMEFLLNQIVNVAETAEGLGAAPRVETNTEAGAETGADADNEIDADA